MKKCPNNCTAVYHACKQDEHEAFFCPNAIVPCINSVYGCPMRMTRVRLNSHLAHCPASVVTCSHEWNRWQTPTQHQEDMVVSLDGNDSVSENDTLDVALAQRDQKKLDEALKMPRELRESLCNPFTSTFPAVPFAQQRGGERDGDCQIETNADMTDVSVEPTIDENFHHMPPGGHPITRLLMDIVHA